MNRGENQQESRKRRSDGDQTHALILDAAIRLASIEGLGSLTIGRLAEAVGISKSGVFAHFRSRERLQRETIEAALRIYEREVMAPGMAATAGLARVQALCAAYLSYVERRVFPGGCFFAHVLAEFDAQSGPIHDQVLAGQRGWLGLLAGQVVIAQEQGELDAATDSEQMAFDLYAAMELANYLYVLTGDRIMVERGRHSVDATLAAATPV